MTFPLNHPAIDERLRNSLLIAVEDHYDSIAESQANAILKIARDNGFAIGASKLDVLKAARDWGKAPLEEAQAADLPRLLDLRELASQDPAPPRFIVKDWLPQREVTLFAGHGGSGKSAIALYVALCIALGLPVYGVTTERRRVTLLSLEDGSDILHWRLTRICAWLGVNMADLDGWLTLFDGSYVEAALMVEGRDGAQLTHVYEWLRARMAGAQVLILDGASDAFGANENARAHVRGFVRAVRRLIPPDGAVLLLAHVDKQTAKAGASTEAYSGSTAWSNSVRARWSLRKEDDDELVLELQKANHAAAGASLRLRWNAEAHVFVCEQSTPTSKLERDLAEADEREAIVRIIGQANGNSIPAATTGRRTSWHALAGYPDFPQSLKSPAGKGRFWTLLDQLLAAGAVERVAERGPNRHPREVLRARA